METENRPVLFGSHDSMTYLKPNFRGLMWLLWPFIMIVYYIATRCQSKNLYQQYKAGARIFDLRLCPRKYTERGLQNMIFAHGIIKFDERVTAYNVIKNLHDQAKFDNTKIYVRIILEQCNDKEDELRFVDFCSTIQERFGDCIEFFGGNRRSDWEKLFIFTKTEHDFSDLNNNQWVSSMMKDARFYEKICPWLYAKRMNKENLTKMQYLTNLFDFI